MNTPRQMEIDTPRRRKYRLNVKKLGVTIIMMVCVAVFSVVMIQYALEEQAQTQAKTQQNSQTELGPKSLDGKLIVIDAGHGGFDPGTISASGTYEDELNLAVSQLLKKELEAMGASVIMTRSDENAIAETKDEDMAERRRIIEESGSDIVLSIHMNSHTDSSTSGPLVLFMPGSNQGKKLADYVIRCVNDAVGTSGGSRGEAMYILKSGNQPCVIVECGYLSNAIEEASLKDEVYQQKLAEGIAEGAAFFLLGV